MGGGGGKGGGGGAEAGGPITIGYHYYLSMHLAICHGPIDYLKDIRTNENVIIYGAKDGEATKLRDLSQNPNIPQPLVINKPSLYGGKKKEGGVGTTTAKNSTIYLLWGGEKQPPIPRLKELIEKKGKGSPVTKMTASIATTYPSGALAANNLRNYSIAPASQGFSISSTETQYTVEDLARAMHGGSEAVKGFTSTTTTTVATDENLAFPAFRGVFSVVWDDLLYQTNSSRPKPWHFKVCRIPLRGTMVNGKDVSSIKYNVKDPENKYGFTDVIEKKGAEISVSGSKITLGVNSKNGTAITAGAGSLWYFNIGSTLYVRGDGVRFNPEWSGLAGAPAAGTANLDKVWYMYGDTDGDAGVRTKSWQDSGWDTAFGEALAKVFDKPDGQVYPTSTAASLESASAFSQSSPMTEMEDANAALIVSEVITNQVWGMGFDPEFIDNESFKRAALALSDENFGISAVWENDSTVEEFLNMILTTVNAVLYLDPASGKFVFKLIRATPVGTEVPVADENNVIELRSYSRMATSELTNQVTIQWTDPILNSVKSATVHNSATREMQGYTVAITRQYPMVTNDAVAMKIAARDLAIMSQPLANVELIVNRTEKFATVTVGDVIDWVWADLGIVKMRLRVIEVGYGLPDDNRITFKCMEDVFDVNTSQFTVVLDSLWDNELNKEPEAPLDFELVNLPRGELAYLRANAGVTTEFDYVDEGGGAIMVLAAAKQNHTRQFDFYTRTSIQGPLDIPVLQTGDTVVNMPDSEHPENGKYYETAAVLNFSPYARIGAEVPRTNDNTTIELTEDRMWLDQVSNKSRVYCNGEFMQVIAFTYTGSGSVTQVRVKRGIFSSLPKKHPVDSIMYFYSDMLDRVVINKEYVESQQLYGKPLTWSGTKLLSHAAVMEKLVTVTSNWANPNPPANLRVSLLNNQPTDLWIEWDHHDADLLQDKVMGQKDGTMVRTQGIHFAVKILNQAGVVRYYNPRYQGWKNVSTGEFLPAMLHELGVEFTDSYLIVAVCTVQAERVSEWNWVAVNPNSVGSAVSVDGVILNPHTPVVTGIADELEVSVLTQTEFDSSTGWNVFEGPDLQMSFSTNIADILAANKPFFSQSEIDGWFSNYVIDIRSYVTVVNTQRLLLARHKTSANQFLYTLKLNTEDHMKEPDEERRRPQRHFVVAVAVEDSAGNLSPFVEKIFANPAPLITSLDYHAVEAAATNLSGMPMFKLTLSNEVKQVDKVEVYAVKRNPQPGLGDTVTAQDFTPVPANLKLSTKDTQFQIPLDSQGWWDFKVRAIDSFGPFDCPYSSAFVFDTTKDEGWKALAQNQLGVNPAYSYIGLRGEFGTNTPPGPLLRKGIIDKTLRFVRTSLNGRSYDAYPVYQYTGAGWGVEKETLEGGTVQDRLYDFTNIVLFRYNSLDTNSANKTHTLWKMKLDMTGFDPV